MGIVKSVSMLYDYVMLSNLKSHKPKSHNSIIVAHEEELLSTLRGMFVAIMKSDERPTSNVEGAVDSMLMRSVCSVMSKLRYEMKDYYKTIED